MVSIHVRPPEVDDRVLPGHWEGDFLKGAGNRSAVGVLVERSSRLVLLAKMDDATAASALTGYTLKLSGIAAPMRQSLTYDQGKEMAPHAECARTENLALWLSYPHFYSFPIATPLNRRVYDSIWYTAPTTPARCRKHPGIALHWVR